MDPKWRPDTRLQHLGEEEKPHGAVTPPIFQNSLFVFPDYDSFVNRSERFWYSRCTNPTVEIAEKKIADLEGTAGCKLFGCGMSAISSVVLAASEVGSHVVCVDTCYGPTQKFLTDYMPRYGVTSTFVTGVCIEEILDAVRPETKLIYLESPSSILFRLQDLRKIAQHAQAKGIRTAIDNSYCSPVYQTPAEFGVDYVIHSATKFLAGHSDITAGAVCASESLIANLFVNEVELITGVLHPFPAWLLTRGLRTLKLRMRHSQETGNALAGWVRSQAWAERVHHAGFDDFEQAALRDSQQRGTVSLFSFEPKDQSVEWSRSFCNALEVFSIGVSWGGFESLCAPLTMRPIDWPESRRIIRLYAGLEDVEDLIADLNQAAVRAGS